jgi:peptide-methionine (S)-S-oxide reductase
METATFAAGCFWGVEEAFRTLPGVKQTRVGYTGGRTPDPDYREVCGGRTGHAEALQIQFDPAVVSFQTLLERFFEIHDPTQVNRQGPDIGEQYRSAIFYHSPEQEKAARDLMAKLAAEGRHSRPIATQLVPASTFHEAEEYHQQYFAKRGIAGCHI